jgi:uncharacterized protein (DUF433 family)
MAFPVVAAHPPLRVEPNGTVRIGQTRITLDTLFAAYHNGATAEQIVAQYPSLSLAEVYETIGYCLRHPEDVAEYLRDREAESVRVRQEIESDPATQQIRARLLARGTANEHPEPKRSA